jgi:predicted flap endonuclease-1-like 5' DNA nuclease
VLYTLSIWAVWLVLAALVGGVIGWLLRSVGAARKSGDADDARAEVVQLRARVSDLESAVGDRDRAIQQLEFQQAMLPPPQPAAPDPTVRAERDDLARKLAEAQHWISELRVRLWNSEAKNRDLQAVVDSHVVAAAPPEPDLGEAARVLGAPVRMNDLTVLEGVGPAIAHLCINRGITTWWSMANADISVLRSMLAEAGPKYQVHDPTSWPQQARLLANGEWTKFQRLAEALRDGYDSE